jgi:hypothetical protein
MKLVLLFILMDLFTVLAYPFVFAHSKLHQANQSEIVNTRKKGIYA